MDEYSFERLLRLGSKPVTYGPNGFNDVKPEIALASSNALIKLETSMSSQLFTGVGGDEHVCYGLCASCGCEHKPFCDCCTGHVTWEAEFHLPVGRTVLQENIHVTGVWCCSCHGTLPYSPTLPTVSKVNSGFITGYRFLGWDPDGVWIKNSPGKVIYHSHWLVLPVHISTGGEWQRKGSIWRSNGGQWLEVGNRGGTASPDIGGGDSSSGGQLVKHLPTGRFSG